MTRKIIGSHGFRRTGMNVLFNWRWKLKRPYYKRIAINRSYVCRPKKIQYSNK